LKTDRILSTATPIALTQSVVGMQCNCRFGNAGRASSPPMTSLAGDHKGRAHSEAKGPGSWKLRVGKTGIGSIEYAHTCSCFAWRPDDAI
jgi:hypothetical protein